MQIQPVALGAIVSPKDYRDAIAAASVTIPTVTLPPTFHSNLGPVLMQAQEPACVSFSMVELLSLWWFTKTGQWVNFSPRFLDTLCKRYDGQDRATGGTNPRLAIQLLAKFGCATTATVPNDTTLPVLEYRDDSILTSAAFAEAAQYKIPGYVSIALDFNSQRQAMYFYGAISSLFSIGAEFWTPSWADSAIDPLRTPNPVVSGHELSPNGWTTAVLNNLRNHWSAAWANNGEAQYNPTNWAPFIAESWAIAQIPQDVQDFLAVLPPADDFHYTWNNNLTVGMQNDDVKFVQIALMILGFLKTINPADLGIYGPKTAAAVLAYQTSQNITPTAPNSIGPKTRAALNAQFAI